MAITPPTSGHGSVDPANHGDHTQPKTMSTQLKNALDHVHDAISTKIGDFHYQTSYDSTQADSAIRWSDSVQKELSSDETLKGSQEFKIKEFFNPAKLSQLNAKITQLKQQLPELQKRASNWTTTARDANAAQNPTTGTKLLSDVMKSLTQAVAASVKSGKPSQKDLIAQLTKLNKSLNSYGPTLNESMYKNPTSSTQVPTEVAGMTAVLLGATNDITGALPTTVTELPKLQNLDPNLKTVLSQLDDTIAANIIEGALPIAAQTTETSQLNSDISTAKALETKLQTEARQGKFSEANENELTKLSTTIDNLRENLKTMQTKLSTEGETITSDKGMLETGANLLSEVTDTLHQTIATAIQTGKPPQSDITSTLNGVLHDLNDTSSLTNIAAALMNASTEISDQM
jgi:predicted  nucleic acid-binding Zn-ribbon protein